jgi:F-type H+-transporting ATPase subunit b
MSGILHNFGVDWKLLLAQAVNFFILLYILKRFAYAPVVKMLREREDRVKRGLEAAAESERRLKGAVEKEDDILRAAEAKALETVGHAEAAAYEKEAEIIEAAHGKAEAVIAAAATKLSEDREKLSQEVGREAEALVMSATARVLGRMNPDERDAVLVRQALDELSRAAKTL